jgi:hypothetical protein
MQNHSFLGKLLPGAHSVEREFREKLLATLLYELKDYLGKLK